MANKVVNLDEFFSYTNESEGVWFEPQIDGVGCGFELKVTGYGSIENNYNQEQYKKDYEKLDKEKDSLERLEKGKRLLSNYCAKYVKGIRGKDGAILKINGNPIEYSAELIENLFYESLAIQNAVMAFVYNNANFMMRKKTN